MRHDLELSKVMKRLVTAVMVFICGAAGYQFYLLMIAEGLVACGNGYTPDRSGRSDRPRVGGFRLYSCTSVLVVY